MDPEFSNLRQHLIDFAQAHGWDELEACVEDAEAQLTGDGFFEGEEDDDDDDDDAADDTDDDLDFN